MYNLIIIGGGPAGYHAAEKAGKAGLSTLLIEKGPIGGVCLNEGCIPSKTLLHCSKLFASARSSEKFGVKASDVRFDLQAVMARKQKVVETLKSGISFSLKKANVEVRTGNAVILGREAGVFRVATGNTSFEGERLLVCTGSEAVRLNIAGGTLPFVHTNREILSVDSLPSRLVVVGAGAIGLELACFFAEVGSAVSVIELLPHIGGSLDKELGRTLLKELEKKGISFHLSARLTAIGDHTVTFESEGTSRTEAADIVLLSVGRSPVVEGFGLEKVQVAVEGGRLKTDEKGRTNVAGIWAAGDVNGVSMLAHTAYCEARVCVDDMLGRPGKIKYDAIPSVIYTHPEAAGVGLTKGDALAGGIEAMEAKLPMTFAGRYCAETEGERGMAKVVVDAADKRIIGVHLLGGGCSEMIAGAAAMIEKKMTVADVSSIVFPHPTVSEIIYDTVRQLQ
jgi:dihydrolipoamide dehydrogenase